MFTDKAITEQISKLNLAVTEIWYGYGYLVRGVSKRAIHIKTCFTMKMYSEHDLFSILLSASKIAKRNNWKKINISGQNQYVDSTGYSKLYAFNEAQAQFCLYNDDSKITMAHYLGYFAVS